MKDSKGTGIVVIVPTRKETIENLISATFSRHPRIHYFVWFDETENEFSQKCHDVENVFGNRSNITWNVGRIGLIEAQNRGVEFAGDRYTIYQHGHDQIGEGIFALADFLDENLEAAYAYGTLQYTGMMKDKVYPVQYDGDVIYDFDYPRNATLYRASAIRAIGGYRSLHNEENLSYNEEHILNIDLYEAGYKGYAVRTEEPALYFSIHPYGLTHSMAKNVDRLNAMFREAFPRYRGTLINAKIFD